MADLPQSLTEQQVADIEAALFRSSVERARRDSPLMDRIATQALLDAPLLAEVRRIWETLEPGSYRYEFVDERGFESLRARLVSDGGETPSRPLTTAEARFAVACMNYVTHVLGTPLR